MKTKLFLALNLAVPAVIAACYYGADDPPTWTVAVHVRAGEGNFDDDTKEIPADTKQVQVVADVKAPPGDWQLTLAADGALALAAPDGGTLSTTVHSVDQKIAVNVEFPATSQPTGNAVIRATLGTAMSTMFTKSFPFVVQPLMPTVVVCRMGTEGDCAAADPSDAGTPADTATVIWQNLPGAAELEDGDVVGIKISTGQASGQGLAWTANVSTDGVLWLVNTDGTTARKGSVDVNGAAEIIVPARINGSGIGRAFVSIGTGPQTSHLVTTGSASTVWRRVEFLEHVGLRARNRVTLCSTRLSGTLGVSLEADAGALTASEVALSLVLDGGPCVEPYPGQADFIWIGSTPNPIWTVTDKGADASTLLQVNALGTDVNHVHADVSKVWLIGGPVDGGMPDAAEADAGGMPGDPGGGDAVDAGGGDAGDAGGGDAGDAGGDAGDAGSVAASSPPTVLVTGTLWRNNFGENTDPGSERLANTFVEVTAPAGLKASKDSFTTDATGQFSFEVTRTGPTAAKSVTFLVDHRIMIAVDVIP